MFRLLQRLKHTHTGLSARLVKAISGMIDEITNIPAFAQQTQPVRIDVDPEPVSPTRQRPHTLTSVAAVKTTWP